MTDSRFGLSLRGLVEQSTTLRQIRKIDLQPGDRVYIRTQNSLYVVELVCEGRYRVSGGWFDRQGTRSVNVGINGCTWGGSAIKIDVVAACGLCLEFGNRIRTSAIRRFVVIPRCFQN